jgi:hypothetical protein
MKSTILKFNTLAELASFLKTVYPQGYTINTLQVTLTCKLTSFEIAVAVEQYNAVLLEEMALVAAAC